MTRNQREAAKLLSSALAILNSAVPKPRKNQNLSLLNKDTRPDRNTGADRGNPNPIDKEIAKYNLSHLSGEQKGVIRNLMFNQTIVLNGLIYPCNLLPENMPLTINHDVDLRGINIRFIPAGWNVKGDLIGNGASKYGERAKSIDKLGFILGKLSVEGKLDINYTNIKELPSDLKVDSLNISDTDIKELPGGLKLDTLDVSDSSLQKLPKNLTCKTLVLRGQVMLEEIPSTIKGLKCIILDEGSNVSVPSCFKDLLW